MDTSGIGSMKDAVSYNDGGIQSGYDGAQPDAMNGLNKIQKQVSVLHDKAITTEQITDV